MGITPVRTATTREEGSNQPQRASFSPSADDIRAKACAIAFGNPLIENSYRGLIAEIIVGEALGAEWRLCSCDWKGWDFEHMAGTRLEVKQSAARQTWTGLRNATKPIFDVRARTGYFDGADWVSDARRFAEIYVFAHHPLMDETADHRDPLQWRFYVVPANRLPSSKTLSLAKIALLAEMVPWGALKAAVEGIRATL